MSSKGQLVELQSPLKYTRGLGGLQRPLVRFRVGFQEIVTLIRKELSEYDLVQLRF